MDFLKYVAKRSHLVGLATATLLLVTSSFVFHYMGQADKLSVLNEGISTCFARVKNSYTAKLLGDGKSLYLSNDFMATTEECFGETLASLNQDFETTLSDTEKILNTVSSDSHWFHQKLVSEEAKMVGAVTVSNYGSRFVTIEENVSKIQSQIEGYKQTVQKKMNAGKAIFIGLILVGMAFMVWETWRKILFSRRRDEIERRALEELNEKGGRTSAAIGALVSEALVVNNFQKTADLFMNFHEDIFTDNIQVDNTGTVKFVTGDDQNSWEQQIEKAWTDSETEDTAAAFTRRGTTSTEPVNCDDVHLDHVLSRVVNLMSSRLFTKGIVMDFDIPEDVYVRAEEEALEQVFYHLLAQNLKGLEQRDGRKNIKISLKKLGGSVLLEMRSNGKEFSNEFIRFESGIGSIQDAPEANAAELEICKEFMNDFGGKVMFENIYSANGNAEGTTIKLLFVSASEKKGSLVDLKRGTKKDILEQINQANENKPLNRDV
ncbi:MAG: hypothetical protein EP319_00540 [Deltaproteobacteria bacterium]|nr:MAG: hypothetical protein EP319_00540 [Deltaproteobacteria bacterium]